jgi:hypothetical protein
MKTVLKLILSLTSLIIFAACDSDSSIVGNNNFVTKEFAVGEFENISNPFSGSVKLKYGNPRVVITAESNIIDLINIDNENKTLVFGSGNNNFQSNGIDWVIYSTNFNELTNNGSANWTSGSLNINPIITANGSGKIELTGKSVNQNITLNSSAEINLEKMPTGNCTIDLNGNGNIYVDVSNNLTAVMDGSGNIYVKNISGILTVTINGSGNLYYNGNPQDLIQTLNGSGRVIKYP